MAFADTLKAVPDQYLDFLNLTQQMILTNASAFAASARSLTPVTPPIPFAERSPDPRDLSDGAFAFVEKVVASQREFSQKLIDIYLPAEAPPPVKASPAKSTG